MKRLFWGLLFGIGGYLATAVAGYFLVLRFSPNLHDRAVEAAMTSVFFYGPIGGIVAFVVGVILGRRRLSGPRPES